MTRPMNGAPPSPRVGSTGARRRSGPPLARSCASAPPPPPSTPASARLPRSRARASASTTGWPTAHRRSSRPRDRSARWAAGRPDSAAVRLTRCARRRRVASRPSWAHPRRRRRPALPARSFRAAARLPPLPPPLWRRRGSRGTPQRSSTTRLRNALRRPHVPRLPPCRLPRA